jgi:lysophospholipase L1-like esterase
LVSGTLRRKLQSQFGDAGHGFVLLASAWPAYHHNDVYRWASRGWIVSRIVGPLAVDGFYGLGGVTFKAPPGARARFGTATRGTYGRAVSRFIIAYLEQPGGGDIQVNLDGKPVRSLKTDAPRKRFASSEVTTVDGEHQLELVSRGSGTVRAFGVVLERDRPGAVLDAIGIQGARIRFLDKQDDAHWAEQLRWREPNLLIFQFGANESADGFAYPMSDYQATMKEVLAQSKRAVPDAGCLVVGAMDRAHKVDDALRTLQIIPLIVERQRAVAAEVGCAFFDTFEAMGGRGSMANWVRRGLGQADMTHPTAVGAEIIGNWLYRALVKGYRGFLEGGQEAPQSKGPAESSDRLPPAREAK